jgi:hypothetical protein
MAGRPKGSTTKNINNKPKEVVEVKDLKEEKSITQDSKNFELENKQLRTELDEIKKILLNLAQNQQNSQTVSVEKINVESINEDDSEIRTNKYIKVMSLNFGKLVLTTEARGQGKVFVFNKFGDVRNIVYSDLANLIHHQQSFAEQGRFYIFDKQVIKNHGLTEYYNKFMTRDMIENILENNREEVINLFNNTSDAQRETIVNILIKKIINGEDVDINKVDIISRLANINIYDAARDKMNNKE